MKLMTWNVQWCRGVDVAVDPARIVAEATRIADFDVLCLQEIADNFPDPGSAAVPARTSSPCSPGCCRVTPRFPASPSTSRGATASGGASAT